MKHLLAIVLVALTLAGCSGNFGSGGPGWAGDLWRDIDRSAGGE